MERLSTERGQRILIHAPPQFGKSILVSQRFPAWLLAERSTERIRLACYNITHATRFGKVLTEVLRSAEYQEMFPAPGLRLPSVTSAEEWSTKARIALHDAQPSFKALGLATGFVGQGADTLIIDDPYASPQDAASPVIRESVWTFWDESARVRLNAETNVVCMFHRYHEDDLAGRLMEREGLKAEGGAWEMLRYAALEDGEGCMPPGRVEGEILSPRFSVEWIAEQRKSELVWLGQFQGQPTSKEGAFFLPGKIRLEDAAPVGLRKCRAWDLAATAGDGNYTVGFLMGLSPEGAWWILDVVRGQWSPDVVKSTVLQTAQLDGRDVVIHGPQDPGQAGKDQAQGFVRLLSGFQVKWETVSGAKETRAYGFAAQVNAGNVRMVKAAWNRDVIEELRLFPRGSNDDIVDSGSDAFEELNSMRVWDFT